MNMVHIAVDAMGGDHAPEEIVAGAIQGARDLNLRVSLVGDPDAIRYELSRGQTDDLQLDIIPACDVIHMDESPVNAVRSKPDASINVACRTVTEGHADGVLTMGHTGAGLIAAMSNFGCIPGVERPAAIVPLLGLRKDVYLIDAGANTEVRPKQLLQFACMGSAYAHYAGGIAHPRIGLLSNGSEPSKGNKVGRDAYQLLAAAKNILFAGNVEGHTMLASDVNVVVCDGFAGNVLFKTIEGVIAAVLAQVQDILPQLPAGTASLLQDHLENIRSINDYARIGAATLLGVQFPMFIGHGRSKALAVRNGLATAKRMITSNVVGVIRRTMEVDE